MLKVGLSACFFHADPQRPIFKGKTLQYLEQSLAHWVQSQGVLVYLVPSVAQKSTVQLRDYAWDLDGLVLAGGSDVSPTTYGDKALKPEWNGDEVRDRYEIELAKEFLACNKPVLGICRGAQLLNVLFGGTLYQDIATQVAGAQEHRNWNIYDALHHSIAFEPGSKLSKWYPPQNGKAVVNSVHHQAIKDLGKGLVVEAKAHDGIIEAIRLSDDEPFAYAVQWHPEFHGNDSSLLDGAVMLSDFLNVAKEQRA
jgi:putative glutamine amidotransferase